MVNWLLGESSTHKPLFGLMDLYYIQHIVQLFPYPHQ